MELELNGLFLGAPLMDAIPHQLINSFAHCLQGFIHPRSQVVQDFFHQQYACFSPKKMAHLAFHCQEVQGKELGT